jgi:TonB-dependent starch-binding outer membrane protein SusC
MVILPSRVVLPTCSQLTGRVVVPLILWCGLLSLAASDLRGQDAGTITGRVVNEATKAPVNSAYVQLVGTRIGTLTNAEGRFQLVNVPEGEYQVRVELVGMRSVSQRITVRAGTAVQLEFALRQVALPLDEIVVTGTAGRARGREVGNAITRIGRIDALDIPVSLETMLQAQAPGMTVLQSSGQIGGAAQIRLRGNVSATMSNQPLVYIDGVRVRSEPYPKNAIVGETTNRSNNEHHSPLNDFNPADIERIEIIKGAAASTLYGTEAAAGVIQIFTKRGQAGRPVWTLEVQQGFQKLRPFAPDPQPYFYLDPWLKNGLQQQYGISVQGGGEALRYFMSAALEDREGVLPNEQLERRAVRGNFSFTPLRGLEFAWNNFFSSSEISNVPGGNNSSGFVMAVYRQSQNHISDSDPDKISQFLNQEFTSSLDRFSSGFTATYAPFAGWFHRLTFGYDLAHNELRQLRPFGFVLERRGWLAVRRFRSELATVDYASTIDFVISRHLRSSLSAGGQLVSSDEKIVDGSSLNFPGPSTPTLTSGSIQRTGEEQLRVLTGGFFGQNVFGLRDRAFFTVGLRIDGSSAFGSGFGLQAYPKVSASYVMHEEPFWRESWGELKLRAAYGAAGRAPGAFDALRTWDPSAFGTLPAYSPQNLGNPNLGPERTVETELGFDASILGGRVTADFTYYHGNTKDALFAVRAVPSAGFQNAQIENVGEIENKGIELALNWRLVQDRRVSWSVATHIATNRSKVLDLGDALPFSLGGRAWVEEGEPLMVLKGVKVKNAKEFADPEIEQDHLFGPNHPTRTIGVSTTIQFPAQITLTARGEYQGGHYIFDGGTEQAASRATISWPSCLRARELRDAGRENELTALERVRCDTGHFQAGSHIYPADFFKVRDITARLPVPFRIPSASSAFITLSAHNWFRWVNKDFPIFEPEMMANEGARQRVRTLGDGQTPPPATFTASLRVMF